MKTIILAGGLGTRLAEETTVRPKPMVEIGNRPLLWHILSIYAAHGFNDFVIAAGYKGECIKQYFANLLIHTGDVVVNMASGQVSYHNSGAPNWQVAVVDTGDSTQTGGRVRRCKEWLDNQPFMLTYGDGVGDIDIRALVAFHRSHGKLATITAVRPPARFGAIIFDGDKVKEFSEKPQAGEGWINGGFMVLQPQVLEYLQGDATVLERGPMERLASEGELMAYRHSGFWQPMDTLRDKQLLQSLWESGSASWKIW